MVHIYAVLVVICAVTVACSGADCGDGWVHITSATGKTCYKLFGSEVDWTTAEQSCEANGATLASIRTPEELIFVTGYKMVFLGTPYMWMGGKKLAGGKWFWQDRSGWTPLQADRFWGPHQPNNYGGHQDCLALWGDSQARYVQWCDEQCWIKYSFMCEKRI